MTSERLNLWSSLCLFFFLFSPVPAHWPFTFRFFIDGGELRSASSYSALVRDRDCVEAEVCIMDAERKHQLPLEEYAQKALGATTAAATAANDGARAASAAFPSAAAADEEMEHKGVEKMTLASSPLVPAPRSVSPAHVAAPRSHSKTPAAAALPSASTTASAMSRPASDASTVADADMTPTVTSPAAAPPASTSTANGHGQPKKSQVENGTVGQWTAQRRRKQQASRQSLAGRAHSLLCLLAFAWHSVRAVFQCCSSDCHARAKLGPCPHCVKLGNKTSFFCSQVGRRHHTHAHTHTHTAAADRPAACLLTALQNLFSPLSVLAQECYTRNWKKHSAEFHPETA